MGKYNLLIVEDHALTRFGLRTAFEEEENYPNTGRLFVRTIAPSSLSEEDEFDITITVKYLELNQDNDLPIRKVNEYKNMYVVRPGYMVTFLNLITSLSFSSDPTFLLSINKRLYG